MDDWFRESMSSNMDDILLNDKSLMYRWLKKDIVCHILSEHKIWKQDYHKILFSLVVFEEWLRSM